MKISKSIIYCILFFTVVLSAQNKKTPYDYVNPLIGTDDMGHTYPGAVYPFGLVQLSPETDTVLYSYGKGYNGDVYKYCAGYQYADKSIVGFSHTHMNGTGHSDLGDILLMPTVGKLKLNPGVKDVKGSGYRSSFSHSTEKAKPGYYAVRLDDYGIDVELTATEHAGFHRYKFPKSDDAHIILDMTSGIYNYDGKVVWAYVRVENDHLITGFRQTNGWARTRYVYFAMEFSKPIKSYGLRNDEKLIYNGFWRRWNENDNFPERAGHKVKGFFNFDTKDGEEILVKVALSGVSTKNALENLKAEIPGWDFDGTVAKAKEKWNRELSKITIEAPDDMKMNFYTSMYHSFLNPNIYSDLNGEYRGLDQNIYKTNKFKDYTTFSLWDTYRALHPLYTIIQQKRTSDIVNSMLAHYEQSVHKMLPIWSHWANDNWCMIGYHAVPVVVDAVMKNIPGIDKNKVLEAVTASANHDTYDGIGAYKKFGYVPSDVSGSSASVTLEYAFDDWTIYRLAEKMGKKDIAGEFYKRAGYYKNLFDKETHFIRAKDSKGNFKTPFDPLSVVNQGYIEGNAWNYSLYVPQDIKGFINLLGGNSKLVTWLDSLFTFNLPDKYFGESEDVTKVGLIGCYVHGNEPSHHVAYMYSYAGAPWKTQERIHQIVDTMYKPEPHGLCGNDDCGQMSAWYIFSTMGFYPVAPGSNQYVIGSPCVNSAVINLENGKKFKITAENLSGKNIYIKEVSLNGKPLNRCYLNHSEIINGGNLKFVMSDKPNKEWGTGKDAVPYSMTKD